MQGRLEVLETIARTDYVEHNPFPGHGQGLEGLRQRVNTLRTAFKQEFTLELLIAEGDKVAILWTTRGTHVGDFLGLPPTGKSYTIQGIDIHQLRDGPYGRALGCGGCLLDAHPARGAAGTQRGLCIERRWRGGAEMASPRTTNFFPIVEKDAER